MKRCLNQKSLGLDSAHLYDGHLFLCTLELFVRLFSYYPMTEVYYKLRQLPVLDTYLLTKSVSVCTQLSQVVISYPLYLGFQSRPD